MIKAIIIDMKSKVPAPKINRWSEGVDHEPEADALARLIGEIWILNILMIHFVLSLVATAITEKHWH